MLLEKYRQSLENDPEFMKKLRIYTIQALFLTLNPGLKEWIANTSLFDTIRRFAGRTDVRIDVLPDDMCLQLSQNGMIVEKPEDLPPELIQHFYEKSPFYKEEVEDEFNNEVKLIENGSRNRP